MIDWAAWGVTWGDSWGSSWGPLHEVEEHPWDTAQGRAPQVHATFFPIRIGVAPVAPMENRAYAVSVNARGSAGAACLIFAHEAHGTAREVRVTVGAAARATPREYAATTGTASVFATAAARCVPEGAHADLLVSRIGVRGAAVAEMLCGFAVGEVVAVPARGVQNPTTEQIVALMGVVRRGRLTRQAASGKRQSPQAYR